MQSSFEQYIPKLPRWMFLMGVLTFAVACNRLPEQGKLPSGLSSRFANMMVDSLRINGGFTGDIDDFKFIVPERDSGYAVSVFPERAVTKHGYFTAPEILDFYNRNKDVLEGEYIGAWCERQPEGVICYLDVSTLVYNGAEARRLASEHKQLAIFDMRTAETIYLNK